ncbi:uncharacterized protein TrAFT101_002051 [Trichoderma asperellum]|uniref:uncharacterized protein n=1 Tax=Trichoderma asperellum TaxID=101201 RepID=UPI003320EEE9|nr:hypothetical protein TrAFT101_002051 [Trichoderma asperellum]
MHLHCTSGEPPAVSQPDLHTTNNQSSLKDSSNCSTGLDKQHSGSPPALSSGTSLSPVSSSVSTPQVSYEHSPLIQREQSEENEKTDSDDQLSPKFKRLHRLWDASEEKFTIMEPAAECGNHDATQTEDCIFVIRRDFNCDKTHIKTTVEIKDSLLKECIQNVTGNIFGVNFTEGNPIFDPKSLFLYLDDFISHHDSLAQVRPYNKNEQWLENQWNMISAKRSLKILIEYLEEEFAEGKKNLDLMLGKGVITFDLLWALWKPHTLIYSPTYRCHDVPRVSMVICAEKLKGRLSTNPEYSVEARFVDFNGKTLVYKTLKQEIQHFNGTVNITSLPVYPLQYHKDEARIRRVLIERGAKFVSLQGIHHKSYTGIAFPLVESKNQTVTKLHEEQSRIMVDPVGFRKVYPDFYGTTDLPIQYTNDDETFNNGVQPQCLMDMLSTQKAEDDQQNLRSDVKIREGSPRSSNTWSKREYMEKTKLEMAKDNLLLLCSPVIVGYSLASLEWLEFDVRCIDDVKWDEEAWDSLVLDEKMKVLIKASVASHISNSAFDVNIGAMAKSRGLTIVLHGPPGTGKTLTVAGLSDHLRCPLLTLPAKELIGCCAISVDFILKKVLTTCQRWNAIVVFDDAQILLEKYDCLGIERDSLMTTLSRRLESFQGIIFLTCDTIRVFDEAFQSRIDLFQKYDKPDRKSKSIILKRAISRVTALNLCEIETFSDEEYGKLVESDLSGREVEKAVELALSLAEARKEPLGVRHLQDIMDIQERFRCGFGKKDYGNYFS